VAGKPNGADLALIAEPLQLGDGAASGEEGLDIGLADDGQSVAVDALDAHGAQACLHILAHLGRRVMDCLGDESVLLAAVAHGTGDQRLGRAITAAGLDEGDPSVQSVVQDPVHLGWSILLQNVGAAAQG